MQRALIFAIFFCTLSMIVLADDEKQPQLISNINENFDDPGPARDLPRSERKRLRLLRVLEDHKENISKNNGGGNTKEIESSHEKLKTANEANTEKLNFAYQLNDQNRMEQLQFIRTPKKIDGSNNADNNLQARGAYSFISADGFKYTTKYVADSKGFRPILSVEKV